MSLRRINHDWQVYSFCVMGHVGYVIQLRWKNSECFPSLDPVDLMEIQIARKAGHHISTPDIGFDNTFSTIFWVHLNPESKKKGKYYRSKRSTNIRGDAGCLCTAWVWNCFPFFFHPRQKAKKIVYVIETGGQGHVLHTHPLPCHVFTLRARARVLRLHRHVYIRTGRLCINKCKR